MALADVLKAPVVKPVVLGFFDIKGAPLRGWSGPGVFIPTDTGDADLDNELFVEAAGPVDITDIHETAGMGGPVTITFSAAEFDDEEFVQEIIADRRVYMRRKAKLWRFFLLQDESAVHPDFMPLYSGVMVAAETHREPGKPATIAITIDQDLSKASTAPVRWVDHQQFYPGDTASTFINDLTRGPLATAISGGSRDTGGTQAGAAGGYPNDWTSFPGWFGATQR